ncbi:MAG: SsrA-binding protein SmpB [Bacteroidetes bacterium]|nr:SsrA-binding protein SmpB [Bacteroidota bacterium]
MTTKTLNIVNRKANFEYHVESKFTAGLVLNGTEVKSIRSGNANISDAFCILENNEILIRNMHISEFKQGSYNNHDPMRFRKLLLNKSEIKKIISKLKDKGTAIFPLKLYANDRGFLKLDIGVGKGKKAFDKRDDIKQKDIQRELSKLKF